MVAKTDQVKQERMELSSAIFFANKAFAERYYLLHVLQLSLLYADGTRYEKNLTKHTVTRKSLLIAIKCLGSSLQIFVPQSSHKVKRNFTYSFSNRNVANY